MPTSASNLVQDQGEASAFPLKRRTINGLELTDAEAFALAQLCKRITWSDCRTLSVDRDECELQIQATNRVRDWLGRNGYQVR